MDESKRDPREDIILIRQMLERAIDGMKTIAPWFTGFGLLWLIYGVFSSLQRLVINQVSLSVMNRLVLAGAVAGILFYFVLAVGFLICRKKLAHLGSDSLARKLVDIWGVCIFLFLILTILLNSVIQFLSMQLGFSVEAASSLNKACSLCRGFLFFLLPVIPLLITAKFLDNRRMLLTGIVLAVLAGIVTCCHALMLFGEGLAIREGWAYFWFGVPCLLDLVPGAMLLLFGRQLKER
ncbi:MAG: hypothetical protein IJG40_00510 [Oscillospiraceae bacterium]|nr:hypothetical protein [Oscillospiraceae bacterium]